MAGKCKYCGFVGTDEMLMDHADKCPALEDCQPDIVEETRHIHQQAKGKITRYPKGFDYGLSRG